MVLRDPAPVETRPLRQEERAKPVPGPGEVLIRIRACGVCRTDLHVTEGELAPRLESVVPGHQIIGTVEAVGEGTSGTVVGDRVGVAWLHQTCGRCRFCDAGKENLCDHAEFTGWTRDGGFAEYTVAPDGFVYRLPDGFEDTRAAPLLCAGIIGYRALSLSSISEWSGARLGIYGFGAAGHIAIQIARHRGAEVYVSTRDRDQHQALALELGAAWVGGTFDRPPNDLDAAIIFAPAGEIVPAALAALSKGGTLVLGGIHMSPIPELDYELIYGERSIRSVANNTRSDGVEFFREAAEIGLGTKVRVFELDEANEALIALKNDAIRGAAVIRLAD